MDCGERLEKEVFEMVSIESNLRVDGLSYGARLDGKKFQRLEYFEQAVGIPICAKSEVDRRGEGLQK